MLYNNYNKESPKKIPGVQDEDPPRAYYEDPVEGLGLSV